MNLYPCDKALTPGTVVFVIGEGTSRDSTWGVTVPYEYWASRSSRKAVATFQEYSQGSTHPQIPLLEFDGNMNWRLCFRTFLAHVKPLCPLEYFLQELNNNNLNSNHGILWACSHRDGSRYYAELLRWLPLFAKAASFEISEDELKGHPALRELYGPGSAILKWNKAYTALRQQVLYGD